MKIREIYNKNPLYCECCNAIIPFEKKKRQFPHVARFCSNSCSVKSTSKIRLTDEVKTKILITRRLNNVDVWNEERRKNHSIRMKEVVNENPTSYSSNNVCGRVKPIKIIDSLGNNSKCLGKWELLVSEFLTKQNIKWTNIITENFQYVWNGTNHRYFPDFKLVETNTYIEVKGFERERDKEKWKQFPYKLIVIKKDEITKIKNGSFKLNI